jgi:hypothetical protein
MSKAEVAEKETRDFTTLRDFETRRRLDLCLSILQLPQPFGPQGVMQELIALRSKAIAFLEKHL